MNAINKTARLAGFAYFLLIPLGMFGILYVPSLLVVPGDVGTTIDNILGNQTLFRLSIASAIVAQLVNIWAVVLLYKLLKPVNSTYAAMMVIFLLLAVPIAFLNELNHIAVLALLNGTDLVTAFTTEQVHALVAFFLDLHHAGIFIAQLFWGLWLFPMGYLVYRSGYLPRIIGILLMIGCAGYMADSFLYFVYPDFGVTVSEFTFLGEIAIVLWLLIRGVNVEAWQKRVAASA